MPKHFYLQIPNSKRENFLSTMENDDLVLLYNDLQYLKENCPALLEAMNGRGIVASEYEDHILPADYFQHEKTQRRFPNKVESAIKYGLFYSFKFSAFFAAGLSSLFLEIENSTITTIVILSSITVMFLPFILSPFNLFYRPLRYVVIRPFNEKTFSKPLKRFLRKNIGLRCHGYTLSDRHFSPNWFFILYHKLRYAILFIGILTGVVGGIAMLAAIASSWIMQSVRITSILAPSGFLHLHKEIHRRKLRSAENFFCGGQCFNIRTINEAWKYSMQFLTHNADFIIVDLSFVREGSQWEINYLVSQGLLDKSIAVCQEGKTTAVENYKNLFKEVLFYNNKGQLQSHKNLPHYINKEVL